MERKSKHFELPLSAVTLTHKRKKRFSLAYASFFAESDSGNNSYQWKIS